MKPLAIDLFCGLGGWTEGLLAEGYDVIGFDIEQHVYGEQRYPAQLVVQDVLTLHGSQFRDATLIVASPPCQELSYMAMPWSLAKAKEQAIRADRTGVLVLKLTELFRASFRIQQQASQAAGRYIPCVVENVRGAAQWVGPPRWNFGSFYLWGDVPALMPPTFNGVKVPGMKHGVFGPGGIQQRVIDGIKNGNDWFGSGENCSLQRKHASKSTGRKAASAMIAKIPLPLSRHIAKVYAQGLWT